MSLPMVVVNVFAVFALIGVLICWGEALTAIIHRRLKGAWRVPFLAAAIAAIRFALKDGGSVLGTLATFGVVFVATSIAVCYVYGWAKHRVLDADEAVEGSGRFLPVMYVWTGCVAFVVAVALLNQAVTGTPLPHRVAGF